MVKKVIIVTIFLMLGVFLLKYRQSPRIAQIYQDIAQITETIAPQPTYITPSGIPNRHLIETTFVTQAPEKNWDQPWQDACEEAALLTVHYFYSKVKPNLITDLNQIFKTETDLGFSHDVNQTEMAQVASKMWGYHSEIIRNPTNEDIKKYILMDIPVIVTANGKTLYAENKHFKNGGPWYHALVILGYDDTRHQFTVHDVGTQYGAYFKYTYDLLINSIHDFPASRQKEAIDTGSKSLLVLLK